MSETVLADISQVSKARTGLVTVATVPSAAYYFYAGNHPQLSGALSPGAHPVD
ncbi:hypothetical protein MJ390_18645 [Klebsiella pneumoniae]|nr:hypothetical protein MJ390_18645 [Klebsiella pneumoniae]